MQKFFMVIGGVFVAVVVIVILAVVIAIPHAFKLDKEAAAYLESSVPKIVGQWNAQELTARATPELLAAAKPPNDLNRYFLLFSRLGALKHLDAPKGGITSSTYSKEGSFTMGNYSIAADFEKGAATIQVQVRHVDDGWKINGFRVNSDALLPPNT